MRSVGTELELLLSLLAGVTLVEEEDMIERDGVQCWYYDPISNVRMSAADGRVQTVLTAGI